MTRKIVDYVTSSLILLLLRSVYDADDDDDDEYQIQSDMEKFSVSKPLEYWVARATDPFVEESDRVRFLDNLCAQVSREAEGPQTAINILAHKILSPNQTEALNTLKAIDLCVRRCGPRVHNEIAKFRFLNQFVRLLSPKYNGGTTSAEVRAQAIQMLFVWQKTMRYLPKFKEVYEMLKKQRVLDDPQLPFEPVILAPPSRLATFEDDEKANLLSQLLKSNNKEDLQAANRLIKSMVRSEDQKLELLNKRKNIIEKAHSACRVLMEVLAFSGTEMTNHESEIAQELFTTLIEIRPVLFRYASEAAENDDSALADILIVNDAVNKALEKYKNICDEKMEVLRSDDLVSLDRRASHSDTQINALNSGDVAASSCPYDLLCEMSGSNKQIAKGDRKRIIATGKKEMSEEETALIVMGSGSEESSFSSNYNENARPSALNDLSVLMTDLPSGEDLPCAAAKAAPTEKELGRMDMFERDNVRALVTCMPYSLSSVSVTLDQLQLCSSIPVTMFDEKGMKGMLCFAENPVPKIRRLTVTVVSISSSYTRPIQNVKFSLSCKNQDIETKLFPAERDSFPAFSPLSALPTITQIFLILPHTNGFSSIDLDYVLTFSSPSPIMISGRFPLYF